MRPERDFTIHCHCLLGFSDGQSYSTFGPNNGYDPWLVMGLKNSRSWRFNSFKILPPTSILPRKGGGDRFSNVLFAKGKKLNYSLNSDTFRLMKGEFEEGSKGIKESP
jgi:hypothetical protein